MYYLRNTLVLTLYCLGLIFIQSISIIVAGYRKYPASIVLL